MAEANGAGLTCPACGDDRLEVKDSRPSSGVIRRRRWCMGCGARVRTYEIVVPDCGVALIPRSYRRPQVIPLDGMTELSTRIKDELRALSASVSALAAITKNLGDGEA